MASRIRVLLVDDEESERSSLKTGFELSRNFSYLVRVAGDLEEAAELVGQSGGYDVAVIDLQVGVTSEVYDGFSALVAVNSIMPSGVALIYSAHPEVENVVRAMQLGATDFVVKGDCPPEQLVEYVDGILRRRQIRIEHGRIVRGFVLEHHREWARSFPAMVLAIAVNSNTGLAEILSTGRSRLEALVNYNHLRCSGDLATFLPVDPDLHIVPDFRSD